MGLEKLGKICPFRRNNLCKFNVFPSSVFPLTALKFHVHTAVFHRNPHHFLQQGSVLQQHVPGKICEGNAEQWKGWNLYFQAVESGLNWKRRRSGQLTPHTPRDGEENPLYTQLIPKTLPWNVHFPLHCYNSATNPALTLWSNKCKWKRY